MYKIGEFSALSKTTIKTLRYYEKEGLLKPVSIDPNTGYRYYETSQLIELSKIISLRQAGLSIKDIKQILNGTDMVSILEKRRKEIAESISDYTLQLSNINYLLEGKMMQNEVFMKTISECSVFCCEGMIQDFNQIPEFVLQAEQWCKEANPDLKCVSPDYCYISYLDQEYKEKDMNIRYAQAVEKEGIATDRIHFMKVPSITAVCIYHKGAYDHLRDSYQKVMKYVEEHNYEIMDDPRECYIDGCWNKKRVDDYLTEIQIPVKKR